MGLGVPPVTTAFTRSQRRGELGAGGATEDGEAGRRDRSARGNAEGVGLRGTWSVLRIEWHGPHHLVSWSPTRARRAGELQLIPTQ